MGDLLRDTGFLAEPIRGDLQKEIGDYARAIIDEEWVEMANGGSSALVGAEVKEMFMSFSQLEPETPRDVNIHAEILTRLNELSEHRRLRLESGTAKVPGLLWAALAIGSLITIGFTWFLGIESGLVHAHLTASLAVMIALTVILIVEIDCPFAGELRVEPAAFRTILGELASPAYPE